MPRDADLDDMQAAQLLGRLADAADALEPDELEGMTALAVASARSPGADSPGRPARGRWVAAVVIAAAVLMIATGATAFILTDQAGNLPSRQELSVEGRHVSPETLEVKQSVEIGGIVWTVISYESSDGPCLDVYADTGLESDPGQSGCGTPSGPFHVSIGGQEIGGRWYNIAYGAALPGSVTASIESTGGTLNVDVVDGTWLSIVPGERLDYGSVTLKDGSGATVAAVELPSLAAQQQAEASLAANTTG